LKLAALSVTTGQISGVTVNYSISLPGGIFWFATCFVTADTVLDDVAKLAGFLSLNPHLDNQLDLKTWVAGHS